MADFKILCKNKSGVPRSYFLFVESPNVSAGAQVYQNVYISTGTVPSGNGTASFSIHKDLFAVTGTNPGERLGSNVTVTTGDFGIAKLCQGDSKPGSTFTMTGAPDQRSASFDSGLLAQNCKSNGSFQINCQEKTFAVGNGANQFIGLGAQDPYDATNIVPVAVFNAQPGTQNIITPKNKYYISWGTFTAGQIIDVTTVATPAEIDFTGKAATLAKVEHSMDGTWNVSFN